MKEPSAKSFRFWKMILDDSLPRTTWIAEVVAFDVNEVIIEEEYYYTNGNSDSDNDSDASSEDSLENFEL